MNENFLTIAKEDIVNWLKNSIKQYEEAAENLKQKAQITKKKKAKMIYLQESYKYLSTVKRFNIVLEWVVDGKFYDPQYGGGMGEMMPPMYADIKRCSVFHDMVFNCLEDRMWNEYLEYKNAKSK